ncbi:hypothetical protein LCGC14_0533510 [marine sediment metagenome]|uniref:Uncharacterized protein n=1 Tax=marine sediment metagenome TaxID=412755 RepID=A0A0F9UGF2_9ZZZZ
MDVMTSIITQKIFKLAELFEKTAIGGFQPSDDYVPPTLDSPPVGEPSEGPSTERIPEGPSTQRIQEGEQFDDQPINLTIDKNQLEYIIKFVIRNVQRDRASLNKRYQGNVPDHEMHRVKHLDAIDNIVRHLMNSLQVL